MTKLLTLFLTCLVTACSSSTNPQQNTDSIADTIVPSDHSINREQYARKQVKDFLKGKEESFAWDTLIKSSSTAIATAEPILFEVFGKEQILSEKPYEAYLIDWYWYITGTLPKSYNKGGAFEIIFSAKDGKIIKLTHNKWRNMRLTSALKNKGWRIHFEPVIFIQQQELSKAIEHLIPLLLKAVKR